MKMNNCSAKGLAMVVSAAAGALIGAALLGGPVARADDTGPIWPFGVIPYVDLPGSAGTPTDSDVSGIPLLLATTQQTVPYSILDEYTQQLLGSYDAKENDAVALFVLNDWSQVIDSAGAAPADGTLFDHSALFLPTIGPFTPEVTYLPLVQNYYELDPTGTTQDLFGFGIVGNGVENYISIGPAGTMDELIVQGFVFPIFDIPATASTGAAIDGGASLFDLSNLF
ncbi:hypothetical protein PT015_00935 [Candidatus Mycobacterium wuenschmannii]|uniref:Uncharacterized protein n=1 Tax=Candidatus Mycobacterium wuenschmannii TaxID=3027808 RepID=A0ABY8VX03_9MYCO|nr:hypothetical protein [Candidatus Mycobacterium wuenschmannii]WIM88123.1 hypothetical protein PT015_00935 [Candidatus Mycobacterium wuenschmannii]